MPTTDTTAAPPPPDDGLAGDVVAAYRAGASLAEVADRFGLRRFEALRILRAADAYVPTPAAPAAATHQPAAEQRDDLPAPVPQQEPRPTRRTHPDEPLPPKPQTTPRKRSMPASAAEPSATRVRNGRASAPPVRPSSGGEQRTTPPRRARPPDPRLDDRSWLRQVWYVERHELADLAAELGCSQAQLKRALQRHRVRRTRDPLLDDPDWLADALQRTGSARAVAAELGCNVRTVTDACERAALDVPADVPAAHPKLTDRGWLSDRYERQFRTTRQIADELSVSDGTVVRWLRHHGIEVRPRKTAYPQLCYRWWLEPFCSPGRTRTQAAVAIAAELDCSVSAAERALRLHGLAPPARAAHPTLLDGDLLACHYHHRNRSVEQIAAALGVGASTVRRAMDRHGIARDLSRIGRHLRADAAGPGRPT